MEMKKQAMNCAFTAIQEEELLRECAAFYCSCTVYLCVCLEIRKWMGPQEIFQAIFFLQGWVNFSPVIFAQYVLKTDTWDLMLSTGAEVLQESSPSSSLSPWLLSSSPVPCAVHYCRREERGPVPCLAALLCMQGLLFRLTLLCNVQSGQSCWNSMLRKSRQAQEMLTLQILYYFFSVSLIPFHGLLLKYRSTSRHKRKDTSFTVRRLKK